MITKIKEELINQPEKLKELLEYFGYRNIIIHSSYISFGRDDASSKKSIVIRIDNNPWCYVTDYARNINQELFKYICEQRGVEFKVVLNAAKSILNITDTFTYFNKSTGIFGGIFSNIKSSKCESYCKTIPDSVLDKFSHASNKRFLKDNISVATQNYFQIGYDVESQAITIPIRNEVGELVGIKARCNYDVEDGEQKYYYLYPCRMSNILFGYYQNYSYLVNNTVYIFESEKSVMQCYTYGIRNCVALGSGSISLKQVKLILELKPKKIVFMHDTGFALDNVLRNINMVSSYSRFNEVPIGYWDNYEELYADKVSASDLGEKELRRIINNELKFKKEESDEEI